MEKYMAACWSVLLILSIVALFMRCLLTSLKRERIARREINKAKRSGKKKIENEENKTKVKSNPHDLAKLFTTQVSTLIQQNRSMVDLKASLQKEYDIFNMLSSELTELLDVYKGNSGCSFERHITCVATQIYQHRHYCNALLKAQKEFTSLLANSDAIYTKFCSSGKALIAELGKMQTVCKNYLNARNTARDGVIKILISDSYYQRISSSLLKAVLSQVIKKGLYDAERRLQDALAKKREYEVVYERKMKAIIQSIVHTTTYNGVAISKELCELDCYGQLTSQNAYSVQSLTSALKSP